MIDVWTVFVLGAGSSCEYDFPLGEDLIMWVSRAAVDGEIRPVLQQEDFDPADLDRLSKDLARTQLTSIDDFLEHRPELAEIGKAVIGAVLPRREAETREMLSNQTRQRSG